MKQNRTGDTNVNNSTGIPTVKKNPFVSCPLLGTLQQIHQLLATSRILCHDSSGLIAVKGGVPFCVHSTPSGSEQKYLAVLVNTEWCLQRGKRPWELSWSGREWTQGTSAAASRFTCSIGNLRSAGVSQWVTASQQNRGSGWDFNWKGTAEIT